MATRDADVGYAEIPAKAKGAGVSGQDLVSMSGGGGTFLNPNTKFPQQAWELIQFIYSPDAIKAALAGSARITARQDVNKEVLSKDPLLSLISEKVLPITRYRPGLAVYPQVSQALQQATADIVSGKSVDEAAATYQGAVEKVAGGADKVQKS
jgi:multiple sugar transport system substrate-binding protein